MACRQCLESLMGIPMGVLPQQLAVGHFLHLQIIVRHPQIVPIYFQRPGATAAPPHDR